MRTVSVPRLAAGDWVIVEGKEPSRRGVGKITDGRYAEDDALEAARVDFANGVSWFGVGDLSRVTPEEEAAICFDALEGGHVPAERARGLEADVEALRAAKLLFVRSPGLLDLLWACLPEEPPAKERTGLAKFFDESRSSVIAWRSGVRGSTRPVAVATSDAPPEDDLELIDEPFIARAMPFAVESCTDVREEVWLAAPRASIVMHLGPAELAKACEAAGVSWAGDDAARRIRLVEALTRLAPPESTRTLAASAAELACRRVLALMTRLELLHAARAGQVPYTTAMTREQLRDAIRLCAPRTAIVGVLDSSKLFLACRAAGVSPDGDDTTLVQRLLAAMTPPAPATSS